MTYRAMHRGKVTELNASNGAYVPKGYVIARTMWTDERGKSVTGGTAAPINAPFNGIVQVFIEQNSMFDENQPLFRIDPR
jgi:hypothetical protein